jgi:trehalose synthase
MDALAEVEIGPLPPERFEAVLPPERFSEFAQAIDRARSLLKNRRIWNINSTARGGGVAEMLRSLIAYARGASVDARWLVIRGTPDFFQITKRLHNHLHGDPGDGGELGRDEAKIYERALGDATTALTERIDPDDIVLVHDPQPAGLVGALKGIGATVIWRCHVGLDDPNDQAREAWHFLRPYIEAADSYVFSRKAFAWEGIDGSRISVIPPSIDAFSPKNQDLAIDAVDAILDATQLIPLDGGTGEARFTRLDGDAAFVTTPSHYADAGPPPPPNARLVVQVSRWDRLKDPAGVIESFARHVAPRFDAHLIVAGPDVEAVTDDPEGAAVLAGCVETTGSLPAEVRDRVHLAALPMEDGEENAAIVNALQRRAEVVVQKSLAEGFGLTVAEAMWKAKPVVATRIGGIQDQMIHKVTGLLVDDPRDLDAFGAAVSSLLDDEYAAAEIGEEAQMRVRNEFLGPRHLMQYVELFAALISQGSTRG